MDNIKELKRELLNARIEANSDHNDGWVKQSFKERVIHLEEKLKSITEN